MLKNILKNKPFRVIILSLLLMVPFSYNYQFVKTDGESMSPTFEDGEWVLMERRRSLGSDWCPQRFDKILVRDLGEEENLSKRVIGLPGDTIELREGFIYLNEKKLQDPFGNGKITFYLVDDNDVNLKYWSGPNIVENVVKYADRKPISIKKGFVWVIGDNRVVSWFGLMPIKEIRGRILY